MIKPNNDSIIEKVVIITGYSCNNNCQFCINTDKKNVKDRSTKEIIAQLIEAKKRDKIYLELIGGELTIRPDIFQIIKTAKLLGFQVIAMATNGRMLSYKRFAKKMAESGITDIIFSVHGHNPNLHDYLTQSPGSFVQLFEGLRNIKKESSIRICSNTTIVKANYRYLPQIGQLLLDIGIRNSEFIFADPTYGGVYNNIKRLMPRISTAAPYIHKCLDKGVSRDDVLHWHIRYVPLCYFEAYLDNISEIYEKRVFHTEHHAPDFKNLDVENSRLGGNRFKPDKCKTCKYYCICEGIWSEYIRNFGDKELMPIFGKEV